MFVIGFYIISSFLSSICKYLENGGHVEKAETELKVLNLDASVVK